MGNKRIFDMGRNLHNLESVLKDTKVKKMASQPDEKDLFGLRSPGTSPRWLYLADLIVSIIRTGEEGDLDRGVYVVKSRYGNPGKVDLEDVINIVIQLMRAELGLNIDFFEDVVAVELREAIEEVLHRHKVLPEKDWNKIMK